MHELRAHDYKPRFVDAWHSPKIVAPETPHIAAAGRDQLVTYDTNNTIRSSRSLPANEFSLGRLRVMANTSIRFRSGL